MYWLSRWQCETDHPMCTSIIQSTMFNSLGKNVLGFMAVLYDDVKRVNINLTLQLTGMVKYIDVIRILYEHVLSIVYIV